MRNSKRHNMQSNPNIATTTDEIKASYARQSVIPPEANRDKSHRTGHLPVAIGGAVLTGLIAAGSVFGYNKMSNDSAPAPDRDNEPNVSAPVTPGETEAAEPAIEFGISAAEIEGNPEKFGELYYEQLNAFYIAGATKENANSNEYISTDLQEYVDEISVPIDAEFIDSIFAPGWEDNPKLSSYIDSIKYVANVARQTRLLTTDSNFYEDIEPYKREAIVDYIEVVDGHPNKIYVEWHGRDNRDQNRGEKYLTNNSPNTETGASTLTTVVIDGKVLISDIDYYED